MATKRSVILRGEPIINEDGVASATVKPGYLVAGHTSIAHSTVSTAVPVAKTFALEKDELGQGIDNTRQGSGTDSAFYASGDKVKVGAFHAGQRLTAFVASGQNIADGGMLESGGDGTLKAFGSGTAICRALEAHAPTNVVGVAVDAIAVEVL